MNAVLEWFKYKMFLHKHWNNYRNDKENQEDELHDDRAKGENNVELEWWLVEGKVICSIRIQTFSYEN